MADRNKFEEMLERLVNEDKAGAEELFHEIVVEKSRDIYEGLLENDLEVEEATDEEVEEATDEEVDESDEDLDETTDEEVEEGFDLDEFEVEADPMDDMGGDPADDMMGDIEAGDDEEGDDEGDEEDGDIEDRVVDLEDALDDLKAEFEKMMDGDEGEDEAEDDMDMDAGDEEEADESLYFGEAEDEEVDESDDDLEEGKMKDSLIGDSEKMTKAEFAKKHGKEAADEHYESAKTAGEQMREYVEKVTATMGDNGADTKSTLAGANNMGGTASNIVAGGEADGDGKADSAKDMSTGNVNVPGGKASKSMKAQPKGHGAEKKASGDNGANTKSVIGK
mgnify:CR=1 FL=1